MHPTAVNNRAGVTIGTCTARVMHTTSTPGKYLVGIEYGGLSECILEATLVLCACGVVVLSAIGECEGEWAVCAPRKPLAGHECAAAGTHVRSLAVLRGTTFGMAVSADEQWLVVGLQFECTLSVYSLPGGELVRTFGGDGKGPLQFESLRRLCFASKAATSWWIVATGGYKK